MKTYVAVSRISGLLNRNKGLARVQAELQTVHSNIRCSSGDERKVWQRIFDGYPNRNRDTFMRNKEKDAAAELLISCDETVRAAVETVVRSSKGSVAKFMELGSVMENTTAYAEPADEAALLKVWDDEVREIMERETAASDPACYEDPSAVAELEHVGTPVAAAAPRPPKRLEATDAMLRRALGMKGIGDAVKKAAANRRGHALEDETLDTMDAIGTKRRGTLDLGGGLILRGECDGVHENRIVEVKNYMYPIRGPPSDKHEIQVHAYMRMFDKRKGRISRQYEGKVRNDDLEFDEKFWDDIVQGLIEVHKRWCVFAETGKWPKRTRAKKKEGVTSPPLKKKKTDVRNLLGL